MKRARKRAAKKEDHDDNNVDEHFIHNPKREELAQFDSSDPDFYRQRRNAASRIIMLLLDF
jgi:hypothetical protein